MKTVGLMEVQWTGLGSKAINVLVRPSPVNGCPGCGRLMPNPHPWGCPVLVRLAAQMLHRNDPAGWRARAGRAALGVQDPWHPEARHWRAVADELDPPDGCYFDSPDLYRLGDGMAETDDPDFAPSPAAADILTPQLVAALDFGFGQDGWELCPSTLADLFPQPSLPGDESCSLPAASPPPTTPTPASPSSAEPSPAAPPTDPSR